jgi:hypothetical protein
VTFQPTALRGVLDQSDRLAATAPDRDHPTSRLESSLCVRLPDRIEQQPADHAAQDPADRADDQLLKLRITEPRADGEKQSDDRPLRHARQELLRPT